jgi:nicotinate-nucleotide adenylyltransferase
LIGFLGGTFDPIHRGHLHAARIARERLGLRVVHLVLAAAPMHREAPAASAHHRWAMLERAVAGVTGLVADDRELRRGGPSYTVRTLEGMREDVGPDEPLVWLLGWDAFRDLEQWYAWQRLPTLAHLAVFRRPGVADGLSPELQRFCIERGVTDPAIMRTLPSGRLFVIEAEMLDVSATRIREMVRCGEDPSRLLTPAVWSYITEQQLYRGSTH